VGISRLARFNFTRNRHARAWPVEDGRGRPDARASIEDETYLKEMDCRVLGASRLSPGNDEPFPSNKK
jgi:hypothetical protein